MSEVKVNKISPRSGTTVTLGDSGDTTKEQRQTLVQQVQRLGQQQLRHQVLQRLLVKDIFVIQQVEDFQLIFLQGLQEQSLHLKIMQELLVHQIK